MELTSERHPNFQVFRDFRTSPAIYPSPCRDIDNTETLLDETIGLIRNVFTLPCAIMSRLGYVSKKIIPSVEKCWWNNKTLEKYKIFLFSIDRLYHISKQHKDIDETISHRYDLICRLQNNENNKKLYALYVIQIQISNHHLFEINETTILSFDEKLFCELVCGFYPLYVMEDIISELHEKDYHRLIENTPRYIDIHTVRKEKKSMTDQQIERHSQKSKMKLNQLFGID